MEQLKDAIKASRAKEEAAIAKASRVANELADKMSQLEKQGQATTKDGCELCVALCCAMLCITFRFVRCIVLCYLCVVSIVL